MDNVCYGDCAESKEEFVNIEVLNLLNKHNCTFNEAKEILYLAMSLIRQERECREYDTIRDYFDGHKSHYCDNEVIPHYEHNIAK